MKLKCKETITSSRKGVGDLFVKEKLYNIDLEDSRGYSVITETNERFYFKKYKSDKLNNKYIWNYFYTPEEHRKLKINKLLKKED